jgi:SAM-dependent MidA family methyltransferase
MITSSSGPWRTWRSAMADALYGAHGFYRSAGAPAAHFRTAAHVSVAWSQAWRRLLDQVDAALDGETFVVVEVGAGGGELLGALAVDAPDRWRLVGVDVCPRPPGLPARVEWQTTPPQEWTGALLAVEWLDVVPVDVVERAENGLRLVEVAPDGGERAELPVPAADDAWLQRWWLPAEVGDRAEVGRSRDHAWAKAVARLTRGVAVAVDYAADPSRDVAGTLTGYRDGRQLLPVPDGSCDLTAHVLLESCAAAVAGVDTLLLSQRDALRRLGVSGRRPSYGGDARSYLAELSRAGENAELLDPDGLGGFTWLLQAKGVALPL